MLGKTRLERELQGLSLAPDVTPLAAANLVLRGVPKNMAERGNEVLLEITPDHRIARIVIREEDGSSTGFRFSAQVEDVALPEKQFHFSVPPGVEVISGELGQ